MRRAAHTLFHRPLPASARNRVALARRRPATASPRNRRLTIATRTLPDGRGPSGRLGDPFPPVNAVAPRATATHHPALRPSGAEKLGEVGWRRSLDAVKLCGPRNRFPSVRAALASAPHLTPASPLLRGGEEVSGPTRE